MIPIAPERYQSIGELLRDALVQFKTDTALIEVDRRIESTRYSYLQFRKAATSFARTLQDVGVEAGTRVAIIMSNQSRWLLGATGVFFRGGIVVPLDYKLTAQEQLALLTHAEPHALLIEYPMFRRFKLEDLARIPHVFVTEAPADAELGSAQRWSPTPNDEVEQEPDFVSRARTDCATIVYSSGTGGRPKGCMLSHDNYLEQYRSLVALYPLVRGDRYFSILPTNHAIDFMCGFLGPLSGGATVVHQRTLRPEFILETMRQYGVTHMAIVPLILEAFERSVREKLDALPIWQRRAFDLLGNLNESLTRKTPNPTVSRTLLAPVHKAFGGQLRVLFCGGAFVDRARAEFFYRLGIPVVIGYGLTEASTVATVNTLKPFRADSVGPAVDGIELEIVAPDAAGVGEVRLRGRTVMMGYFRDPDLSAETLREGWLYTGDRGYLDASGHLHLVGRSKNMIVTEGGKNVYPEDIESAFEGTPCDELCVFASGYLWPSQKLTDEMLIVVAKTPQAMPLMTSLRAKNLTLADYKRVRGVLLWDEAFPRTASMKLKREVLASQIRERATRDAVRPLDLVSSAELTREVSA